MKEYQLLRASGIIASFLGLILILFGNIKTPENFRFLSDFIQNILVLVFVMLVFWPDDNKMKIALIIGVCSFIYDWIIETIAVHLDLWHPLGGFQAPPLIIVPFEMVLSFLIIGTSFGIFLSFPQKVREMDFILLNWLKPLFKDSKYDWLWRLAFIILNTIVSSLGDLTAGSEIFVLGGNWEPHYIVILNAWLWLGLISLIIYQILVKKYERE